jgi:intein/homing endonuclease
MAHFRLLSDTNFLPYGKSMIESARRVWKQLCLAADSKIWTDSGYKYISDINIGDVVYSYDYTSNSLIPTTVKNHQRTGHKPVYEIKTGHRTIRGTYEHPIMVANGIYKNMGELTTDDYLIVGNHIINNVGKLPKLEVDTNIFVAKFNDEFYAKNLIDNKQICKECGCEFGRLTGNHLKTHDLTANEYYDKYNIDSDFATLFHRNGRISYNSALYYCDMMNISADNLDVYMSKCTNTTISENTILKNIPLFIRFVGFMLGDGWVEDNTVCFSLGIALNKSMKYVELMGKLNVSHRVRNEGLSKADCVVSSTYLRTLLTDVLDFRTGTFNKIVPDWVYALPLDLRREFLYGFADADGSPINNGFSVSSANKNMLESLHTLAQQSGFTTTNFRSGVDMGNGKSITYGFEFGDSRYHMQLDNNGVLVEKIRSIKVMPSIDVYDIEVDNELHNFISDGVVTHNCLMEDAMLIHRIMRAPEKRIFKIDIGNINPTEVDNYMQKIINKMKKVPFVDKNTGDYNLKYNMQNLTEDFFLPVRGGDSGTSIDNLGGLEYAATEDIEFLQKKLFAALKVPKAYLSYDESISGKATLAAEDVRFARTIERIQRTIVSELTKIAIVHLAAQGIDDIEMVNFELSLTNASTIYEQEKVNLWSEKVRLASDIQALKMLSKDWVYSNLFGMSDVDKDEEKVKLINDLKDTFRYNAIENDGNDPATEPEPTKVEDDLEELKTQINNRGSGGADGGRPREGNTYGKDKHPYGRDPLGDKENHAERKRENFTNTNNKKLAREYINGISAKKRIINEKKDFLDDKNLLDDDKI